MPFCHTVPMPIATDVITVQVSRDERSLDVEALYGGSRAGYASCTIQDGERLLICDLKVENRAPIPYPIAHNLLIALGIPCRTRNFRGLTVPSSLMWPSAR